LDEAAYIPATFIQQVVVPMMQKDGVVVLGISTSGGPQNYYTKLRELTTDLGTPLFRFITITRICKECRAGDSPEKCTHMLHLMPPWKSMDRFKMCEKLLSDVAAGMQREILGLLDRESGGAFPIKDVDALKAAHAIQKVPGPMDPPATGPTMVLPDLLFITVDPGPGSSETAMVASCYENVSSKVVVRVGATAPSAHTAPPMSTQSVSSSPAPPPAPAPAPAPAPPPVAQGSATSSALHTNRACTNPAVHAAWACGTSASCVSAVGSPLHSAVKAGGSVSRSSLRWRAEIRSPKMSTRMGQALKRVKM
jgi:hypothetical protein